MSESTPPALKADQLASVRKLLPFVWRFRWRIGLALTCLVAAKLATIAVPLIMKALIDGLDVDASLLAVPVALLIAYATMRLGSSLFAELRQIVFARVMARVSREVMLSVFRHLHALSYRFHSDRRTGGLARDVERGGSAISDLLDWTLYTILPTLLEVALVSAILVLSYDWSFALITLATLVVYVIYTLRITEWRTRFYREAIEADTQASSRAVDSLLNYETVKYFGNEEYEARAYDRRLVDVEQARVKSLKSLALLNVGQNAIISIGVVLLMWRATVGVVEGRMTLGDLVLVNAFLLQLSGPLNFLGMMYREVKQALGNLERLFGLLGESMDIRDRPDAPALSLATSSIRFEQVSFGYDERRRILHSVDFNVAAGRTVAVVGHSGSGKSTLSRLLYRFFDVESGRILIGGEDIREVSQASVRAAIAIVPQDTVLFNDTILYNIQYGRPDASREEVIEAAKAAHIHDFIMRLPDGYDSPVGERGLKLSGGEKQRVSIARALLKNPPILIFDEATSALDSKSEKAIQAEIMRIARDRTALVIAHRLSTVMDADEILVLDAGHVVERGTHDALLAANGQYAHMWQLQQQAATREEVEPVAA